jgi:hypothetical protein
MPGELKRGILRMRKTICDNKHSNKKPPFWVCYLEFPVRIIS